MRSYLKPITVPDRSDGISTHALNYICESGQSYRDSFHINARIMSNVFSGVKIAFLIQIVHTIIPASDALQNENYFFS